MSKVDTIYIDFDGVIVDTIAAIVELYNDDFRYYKGFKEIKPEDIHTYGFEECTCASKEIINTYFNTLRFFRNLEMMPKAWDSIWDLTHDFSVQVVSHGYSPNLAIKKEWVNIELCYGVDFRGINLKQHSDKSCVDMSNGIFIDDKLKNLETSNAAHKILFGKEYEWNRGYDPEKIHRCYDWDETMKTIKEITGVNI